MIRVNYGLIQVEGPHLTSPAAYSSLGMIGFPSSPVALKISKQLKIEAMAIHMESFAMNLPGQILLPNPNAATAGSRAVGSHSPFLKYLSGLNFNGSG